MSALPFERFDALYQEVVGGVLRYWTPEMQTEIARHCRGWAPDRFDFGTYLRASSVRFFRAYRDALAGEDTATVCDVGGFFGVFPITLARLGYKVTMTEAIRYYQRSFDDLFGHIVASGVRILDAEPFEQEVEPDTPFDAVTVLAVLEHYPHSPKRLVENVVRLARPGGAVYLEVPNIAHWPKRVALLRGRTPLVPILEVLESEVPFIGHHHEYTIAELRALASRVGLRIERQALFNYTATGPLWRRLVRRPLETVCAALIPDAREIIGLTCRRPQQTALPPSASVGSAGSHG